MNNGCDKCISFDYCYHCTITTSRHFHRSYFSRVREDLTSRFGGVTAFVRSPAVGLWKENSDDINREEIVMFEVLADQLDKEWWASYRKELEDKFRQEELLIWAFPYHKVMNEHSRVLASFTGIPLAHHGHA